MCVHTTEARVLLHVFVQSVCINNSNSTSMLHIYSATKVEEEERERESEIESETTFCLPFISQMVVYILATVF